MEFLLKLKKHFMEAPFDLQLTLSMVFIILLLSLLAFFVFPIVFNCFIIPRVEARLGKKLHKWGTAAEVILFGKFMMKYIVVTAWVFYQYFIIRFSRNPEVSIKRFNQNRSCATDLAAANYDIREAPRYEIIMSFLALANIFLLIILITSLWFYLKPLK